MTNKPKYTWLEYLDMNPDTKYNKLTYCAGGFTVKEAGKAKKVGDVFKVLGDEWRIVLITNHPFNPIKAVPSHWPENYYE